MPARKVALTARLAKLRLRHFELLDCALQTGSLGRAGRILGLSQPAASALLADLESAMGAPLFERSRRGVQPTSVARALAGPARLLLSDASQAFEQAQAAHRQQQTPLRVGVLPRAVLGFFPGAVKRFRALMPQVPISLNEAVARELIEQLAAGELDAIVARRLPDVEAQCGAPVFVHRTLYHESFVMLAPAGHPLASKRKPSWEELAEASWVLPPAGSEARRLLVDAFLGAGVEPPRPCVESASVGSNLRLAANAGLLTLAPAGARRSATVYAGLRTIRLALPATLSPIAFMCLNEREESPRLVNLWIALRDAAGTRQTA
jgi:DNA-binding transcriptional LysR family regulator